MRHAITIFVAACVVYVSTPSMGTFAQGSSVGEERLYVASDLKWYHLPAATATPETTVGFLSGTNCYPGPGFANEFTGVAPDGTLYGFITDCAGGTHWGRVNPETAVVTPLHLIPATNPVTIPVKRLKPAFVTAFGAPGSPLGYRVVPDRFKESANLPLSLYQVDALMPYREHLVIENLGLAAVNFGLGTVVRPWVGGTNLNYNGHEIYYVTRDAVYVLMEDSPSVWGLVKIIFLTVYQISSFATVTNFDGSNTYFHIVDGNVTYRIDIDTQQVQIIQFPDEIGRAVSGVIRRTPWGGVRIEPHEGLATNENGGTATFTAALTAPPIADVTVQFTSSDTTEGTVSPSSATFTTGNWNVAQTITVTGVADSDTANQTYSIVTSSTSSDLNYHARAILDVDVTNTHINQLPTMTPGAPGATQGNPEASVGLGTVNDLETAPGALSVTTLSVPAGVTVGTITNSTGSITAPLAATCAATPGANTLTLRITDAHGGIRDQDVTVAVTANPAPTLGTYGDQSISHGTGTTAGPSAAPADNISVSSVQVSAPSLTGALSVDQVTGVVSIGNAAPIGTHTVTVTASDNCAATVARTFALTVTCTAGCNWTDATLAQGASIRAAHVLELRARIDARRQQLAMSPFAWTDTALTIRTTGVRAVHLNELRTALLEAYAQAARPAPSFTDSPIVAGATLVRAVHISELRTAVEALEQ